MASLKQAFKSPQQSASALFKPTKGKYNSCILSDAISLHILCVLASLTILRNSLSLHNFVLNIVDGTREEKLNPIDQYIYQFFENVSSNFA